VAADTDQVGGVANLRPMGGQTGFNTLIVTGHRADLVNDRHDFIGRGALCGEAM
jgi:hypothetical protein